MLYTNLVTSASRSTSANGAAAMDLGSIASVSGSLGGNVISDVVTTLPVPAGGTKRPQEDHASMDYDGTEVEAKAQRISSICLGIGSDDITGEIDAANYDEDLVEMADYLAQLTDEETKRLNFFIQTAASKNQQ